MRVLVTGGAGYIGSHTVVHLVQAGHDVVIVDNLSNAKATVLDRLEAVTGARPRLHVFDLRDHERTEQLFTDERIEAVVHFAGYKAVGESVEKPLEYYDNNLGSTFSLVRAMQRHGVTRLVFSSSATVYGPAAPVPYREDWAQPAAESPYGRTKLMIEQVLTDAAHADQRWRVALLRYFNPVGAHPSGQLGEDPHGVPNNLLPFIAQVASGRRAELTVFGNDYDTPDGTCQRDYIHVQDVAAGHLAALQRLQDMATPVKVWNLGTGRGTSVLEMIRTFEKVSGRPVPFRYGDRRSGDLPAYWADPSLAHAELGWSATREVEDMCADTWRWQRQNPDGYPAG